MKIFNIGTALEFVKHYFQLPARYYYDISANCRGLIKFPTCPFNEDISIYNLLLHIFSTVQNYFR